MRWFKFDLFKHIPREELTIDALRNKAAEDGVDVSPRSFGGEKPLTEGVAARVVTSGDLMSMFAHHARPKEAQAS